MKFYVFHKHKQNSDSQHIFFTYIFIFIKNCFSRHFLINLTKSEQKGEMMKLGKRAMRFFSVMTFSWPTCFSILVMAKWKNFLDAWVFFSYEKWLVLAILRQWKLLDGNVDFFGEHHNDTFNCTWNFPTFSISWF